MQCEVGVVKVVAIGGRQQSESAAACSGGAAVGSNSWLQWEKQQSECGRRGAGVGISHGMQQWEAAGK